jgi:hypothetical protein
MTCSNYAYSNPAITQMFKRGISADEVEAAIINGEKIKDYPADETLSELPDFMFY